MVMPKSINDCLFFDYDTKAEYLYEEYDLNKYISLLIRRIGIINKLKSVCAKSLSSCLSRYIALSELFEKGFALEKYNIEGEFKIKFCNDLINKITMQSLYELEEIAKINYGINLKECSFNTIDSKVVVLDDESNSYEISTIEGKLYVNYHSVLIGDESKINTYLDWVGEVIELEGSKK